MPFSSFMSLLGSMSDPGLMQSMKSASLIFRFLIAFYCILMLILASGGKLLGLSKIVFITRFAAKAVNNILSIIRMLEWFQFAD